MTTIADYLSLWLGTLAISIAIGVVTILCMAAAAKPQRVVASRRMIAVSTLVPTLILLLGLGFAKPMPRPSARSCWRHRVARRLSATRPPARPALSFFSARRRHLLIPASVMLAVPAALRQWRQLASSPAVSFSALLRACGTGRRTIACRRKPMTLYRRRIV